MKTLFAVIWLFLMTIPHGVQATAAKPDTSSKEWIKTYFNMPGDHSVALPGNQNNDRHDLMATLISLIDSANTSVDLAIYDLENPRIGWALARAEKRGVHVRIVTDNYHRRDGGALDSLMWSILRGAHITSIDDDGDIYEPDGSIADHSLVNAGADMHHKFAVIDGKNASPDDDIVWSGSTNLTLTGAYNSNNVIVIKDSGVAAAFLKEFEQMWGDDDLTPDARQARFHKDKKRQLRNHVFWVNKTRVDVYFSPVNRPGTKPSIMKHLTKVIKNEARHDVDFLAFAITPSIPLSREIWRMSATGDIRLNGIIDPLFYYQYKHRHAIWASPAAQVTNRTILPANELRKLHDKVMLIDAASPDSSDCAVTFTGSYNFSHNANVNNDENLLIIYSNRIANQYYQDFRAIMSRAQHKTEPPAPPLDVHRWYEVQKVKDGSKIQIKLFPGFNYGVEPLGVEVPRIYADGDSAEYYSGRAADYLRNLLAGAKVKLQSPAGGVPRAKYGAFHAYVTLKKAGQIIPLNKKLLEEGMGSYSPYYAQHPGSIEAFNPNYS